MIGDSGHCRAEVLAQAECVVVVLAVAVRLPDSHVYALWPYLGGAICVITTRESAFWDVMYDETHKCVGLMHGHMHEAPCTAVTAAMIVCVSTTCEPTGLKV